MVGKASRGLLLKRDPSPVTGAVAAPAESSSPTAPAGEATPSRTDDIWVLELGKHAPTEARALQERSSATVREIAQVAASSSILASGPLTEATRIQRFLASVLPAELQTPARVAALSKLLERLEGFANGEPAVPAIGRLMAEWAKGEVKGTLPTRMLISGESTGSNQINGNGLSIDLFDLLVLAKQFPKVAAAVEDLAVSGCNTGYPGQLGLYRSIFGQLKTLLAYVDEAPSAVSGALPHLTRWERRTRGPVEVLDREAFRNTRMGDDVMTWSVTEGPRYSPKFFPLAQVGRDLAALRLDSQHPGFGIYGEFHEELLPDDVRPYFRGELSVKNPDEGPLRDYYRRVQNGYQALPAGLDKERLRLLKALCVRLLYYPSVATAFAERNSLAIATLFSYLRLPPPDFAKLSRGEAYQLLSALRQQLTPTLLANDSAASRPALYAFNLLWGGLFELNEAKTPEKDWL